MTATSWKSIKKRKEIVTRLVGSFEATVKFNLMEVLGELDRSYDQPKTRYSTRRVHNLEKITGREMEHF